MVKTSGDWNVEQSWLLPPFSDGFCADPARGAPCA
jgi:hypothetical protein